MKINILSLATAMLALGVTAFGGTPPADSGNPPAGAKPAAAPADKPEAALKADMPAEMVQQIMGQPVEVKPMKTPSGHAEIWVYKRVVGQRVDRQEIATIPVVETVVGSDGKAYQHTVGQTIQYGDVHITTEETLELLMFNDHFVTGKVSRRDVKHYD
jgi:hypothetical protein